MIRKSIVSNYPFFKAKVNSEFHEGEIRTRITIKAEGFPSEFMIQRDSI